MPKIVPNSSHKFHKKWLVYLYLTAMTHSESIQINTEFTKQMWLECGEP